mmetsp:Transcript_29638/g.46448  ORF Transcript_29638/g.46448 Transcript_29638/m.46448 type:complete len:89 (+) Transcript_29638:538-804(+)
MITTPAILPWIYPQMQSHLMVLQVLFCRTLFAASFTYEPPVSSSIMFIMNTPNVSSHVRLLGESLTTELTFERSLSSVGANMVPKGGA